MKNLGPALRPLLLAVIIVVAWQLATSVFGLPTYLVPEPLKVLKELVAQWPRLLSESMVTTAAALGGFALSVVVGLLLAVLIVYSKTIESYLYPLLVFSQSVPKIAVAPLFVVWFGFGIVPKVISAFLLGVFPVVVAGVQGFKSVEADMRDLARSMKASRLQTFAMVSLPHAMPAIFAGLKVSVTLAVVGAVVGEFVGSNSGLGFVLQRSIGNFELPTMFAALIVLALIGVVLFWVIDLVERLIVPWHASQRHDAFVTV